MGFSPLAPTLTLHRRSRPRGRSSSGYCLRTCTTPVMMDIVKSHCGAYGAGVLVGLTESGKRPDFAVVTGVSIGAVMAPYAFLGPKYDDQLRESFLTLTSADVFEDAQRPDSLVDTWPLKDLLAKRVTPLESTSK